MAPIKFEENIKQRLEKRTIEPSSNAWDKLSRRLDDQGENSNNKIIWWIGIAASFIGAFLVVTLFVNTNDQEAIIPEVVETPVDDSIIIPESNTEDNIDKKTIIQSNVTEELVFEDLNKTDVDPKNSGIEKRETTLRENEALASNNPIAINENANTSNEKYTEEKESKATDALSNKSEVQIKEDPEIDLLLKQAQQDIALRKNENDKKLTIDSNALLEDVETDLDQSFREKIFETIITSYNSVKTAVAQRND